MTSELYLNQAIPPEITNQYYQVDCSLSDPQYANQMNSDKSEICTENKNQIEIKINASATTVTTPVKSPSKNKRKRKSNEKSEEKQKKPKKTKSTYQRKNIKKVLNEKELNESTLKALKEEQERIQRLNLAQNQQPQAVSIINNENLNSEDIKEENFEFKNEPVNFDIETYDENNLLDEVNEEENQIKIEDGLVDEDNHDDLICLDDSNLMKNEAVDEILIEDEVEEKPKPSLDDSDDIQILEDHEVEENVQKKPSGLHMDDDLNVPDTYGRVLINVNHPPTDPDIFLEPSLVKHIKPHQIGGIRFMYSNIVESLEQGKAKDTGFGCILAHSMGLGKTLQVISFIEIFLRCTSGKRVLCIVPINTIQNWLSEFNNWLPESNGNYKRPFKVFIINENVKTFSQRSSIIIKWRDHGGVLLIGYEMFRTFITQKAFRQPKQGKNRSKQMCIDIEEEDRNCNLQKEVYEALLEPCLVICDEGHRVKNSSANIAKTLKSINTKRRIILTGYPLQNNLIEYWCMVDFVRPSYLGTKTEFSNMFERPIMNGQCSDSTNDDIRLMRHRAHVLHTLLEGFVQRRGHDVLYNSLPKKEEYVILLKLSPIQKEMYLSFMEAIGAMTLTEKPNPLRTFAICCKIWNHPDVLYDYVQNKEMDIDLDLPDLQQPESKLAKNQQASFDYIFVDNNSQSPTYSNRFSDEWSNRFLSTYVPGILSNGSKFEIAFKIIEECVKIGDKVLLFSQSLLSLNLIEKFLSKLNVPNTNEKWEKYKNFYRLDGSTSGMERERLISSFNVKDNGVWLFLLSTRAGCLGINLVGANRVIVLDASFNPCHDAQAVCRVYRYGQQKPSHIYRLITDHTMEKRIYDRQINKQTMSDRVIDEIQAENHLTRVEIEKLIHYVQEDEPPADLSNLSNKFHDPVLLNSCLENQRIITKEPFKHESLLLDKKEYQLTNREKRAALQDYRQEKELSYNYGKQSYSSVYRQAQNQPNLSRQPNSSVYNHSISYNQNNSFSNNSSYNKSPSSNDIYKMYKEGKPKNSPPRMSTTTAFMFYMTNKNPIKYNLNNNNKTKNITTLNDSASSDIEIIEPNKSKTSANTVEVNQNQTPTNESTMKDISIRRFVTTTTITIPPSSTSTNSVPTVIPAGKNVALLNTPKGVYLRLPDGRFFAIRDNGERALVQNQQNGFTSPFQTARSITSTTSVNTQPISSTVTISSSNVNMYNQQGLPSNPTFYRSNSLDPSNLFYNDQANIIRPNSNPSDNYSQTLQNVQSAYNQVQNPQLPVSYDNTANTNNDTANNNSTFSNEPFI